jgi:hypothetical protein
MVVYLYGYWKYFLRGKTSWMLNGWIYIWFNISKFILLYVFLYNVIAKNYHDQNYFKLFLKSTFKGKIQEKWCGIKTLHKKGGY